MLILPNLTVYNGIEILIPFFLSHYGTSYPAVTKFPQMFFPT